MSTKNFISYFIDFENIDSRLDFVYYDPKFEEIKLFRNSLNTIKLGEIISQPEYGNSLSGRESGIVGFLNGHHISEEGDIIFNENPSFIDFSLPKNDLLNLNDILISRSGTVGKAAIITDEYKDFAFGSFCIKFTLLDPKKYLPLFIAKFINSYSGALQVELLKTGSLQSNINSDQIKDISIPKIDPTIQQQILEQIKPIDDESKMLQSKVIELQREAIDFLLNELGLESPRSYNYFFKSGAEQNSLTFNIFNEDINDRLHYLFFHPKFQILDTLKFKTVTLESICTQSIIRGEQPEYDDDGQYKVLKTVNLKNKYIDLENALHVDDVFFEKSNITKVQKGDILIASTGYTSMGKIDVYDSDEIVMVDGHISIVRVNKDYDPYFIAYFLRSYIGQIQIEKYFTGSSGQIELQPHDLGSFIIPSHDDIPLEQQTIIANIITNKINHSLVLEKKALQKKLESKELFEKLIHSYI